MVTGHDDAAYDEAEYDADLAAAGRRLDEVVARLRRLTARAWRADGRAAAARGLAMLLAEIAQGVEERERSDTPAWRTLPDLPDHVLADAVAVTGHDAVTALSTVAPSAPAWSSSGRTSAAERLATLRTALGSG